MPQNGNIDLNADGYTLIGQNVAELTFQNKSAGRIELTAVATGAAAPAVTVSGILAEPMDGRTKMPLDDVFLHVAGGKDVYAKISSGVATGAIFVNHA